MKRGTPRHPKVIELATKLAIPQYGAVGILELLWHFTAEFCHAGDIGKFSDEAIAQAVGWPNASTMLVSCLVETRWLDRCDCHRLRIHDWPDHADQTVQRVLTKRNQRFLSCYDGASMKLASSQHKTSQPSPSPSPSPSPIANSLSPIADSQVPSAPQREVKKSGTNQRPTDGEAELHANKIGLPMSELQKFLAYYDSNGWKVGKNPMVSWRAAMSGWKTRWETNRRPSGVQVAQEETDRKNLEREKAKVNAVIAYALGK